MVPPVRQIPCAKCNLKHKNVPRRRDWVDWMQAIACSIRWTIWTPVELRVEARVKVRGDAAWAETVLFVVLKFFVPGHLNRFELAFVG